MGISLDAAGNVYVADFRNNRIRKITTTTGIITTVAGTNEQDYCCDGSEATSAYLNYVSDVEVDAVGNFYLTDTENRRVRKVTIDTTYYPTPAPTFTPTIAPSAPTIAPSVPTITPTLIPTPEPSLSPSTLFLINTIAGTGSGTYSGDNGAATSGGINYPVGITLDASGKHHHLLSTYLLS